MDWNNVRESRGGASTVRRSRYGWSWWLCCQQRVCYPQHLLTQELTSTCEPRGWQSRRSRTPAGCQLRQSHLRSHKSNHVLQVRFFLGGPMALITLWTLKVRTVPSIPGMSLTSLCSNTSTGTADIYACLFLLLISHTESSLFQTGCLQIMLFLKEFCVLCYSDQSSTSWYWDGITF